MPCETNEIRINETTYICTQWKPEKSMMMKFRLGSIFGSTFETIIPLMNKIDIDNIGKSITSEGKDKSDDSEAASIIIKSITTLFETKEPSVIMGYIKDTVKGTFVEYDDDERKNVKLSHDNFDTTFDSNNLMEIYKVFFFVLRSNYSNLFKGWKS